MPKHFKSKEAYRKYEAYKHIHHIKAKEKDPKIWIAGKRHHVKHGKKKR